MSAIQYFSQVNHWMMSHDNIYNSKGSREGEPSVRAAPAEVQLWGQQQHLLWATHMHFKHPGMICGSCVAAYELPLLTGCLAKACQAAAVAAHSCRGKPMGSTWPACVFGPW